MRAVLVLFDSLNRHALGCYGGTAVATPNFDRFASRGNSETANKLLSAMRKQFGGHVEPKGKN